MELNKYQELAMKTCTESSMNLSYAMSGFAAEVGEVADKVAKAIRKEIIEVGSFHGGWRFTKKATDEQREEFMDGIRAELGDCLWFIALFHSVFCFTMNRTAEGNIGKLASRQERGVIVGNGDNR